MDAENRDLRDPGRLDCGQMSEGSWGLGQQGSAPRGGRGVWTREGGGQGGGPPVQTWEPGRTLLHGTRSPNSGSSVSVEVSAGWVLRLPGQEGTAGEGGRWSEQCPPGSGACRAGGSLDRSRPPHRAHQRRTASLPQTLSPAAPQGSCGATSQRPSSVNVTQGKPPSPLTRLRHLPPLCSARPHLPS